MGEGGSARTASLPPGVWGEEGISLLGGEGEEGLSLLGWEVGGEHPGYWDERREDRTQREGRR